MERRLAPDGAVEQIEGGYRIRFERYLAHPKEKVWRYLTDPDKLRDWLAAAELELTEGGRVTLRWQNTDTEGNYAVARGTITRLEPPTLIEMDTDIHGLLTWELEDDGTGCILRFSASNDLPDEYLALVLAGWHIHFDFLEEALDGQAVDWPNWPLDRWQVHHDRYARSLS
ncbi:SRPBCC family protein [soil metagenome]